MINKSVILFGCGLTAVMISVHGCGAATGTSSSASVTLPLITPPVKSATPASLGGSATSAHFQVSNKSSLASPHSLSLLASDIKSRFFTTGPTNIFGVLSAVDNLISSVNASTGACLTQTPVTYNITPFGQTVKMYAQCSQTGTGSYPGDPALFQFGVSNNLVYIYSANGAEWTAAVVSPLTNTGQPVAVTVEYPTASPTPGASAAPSSTPTLAAIANNYQVEMWIGLGYSNTHGCSATWDGCSYGAMHLLANTVTKTFELTVAGMGFGYCGVSLKSDGTNLYVAGSADGCAATDTACVSAADGITPGTCSTSLTTFALTPLGRTVAPESPMALNSNQSGLSWGASQYPGGTANNVTLNGTSSDAIHFGPTTATTGTGSITFSASASGSK